MISFLVLYLVGQNVVFNPGFDMVPWDTGWTTETDTATNPPHNGYAVAEAEVKPDTGKSPSSCCYLKTNAELVNEDGWSAGKSYAKAVVSSTFDTITDCIFKAQIEYWWGPLMVTGYWEDKVTIDARIDNQWQTIWDIPIPPSSEGGDTIWSEVSVDINGQISGIRFITLSYLDISCFEGDALHLNFHFWIDDIYIGKVGVKEKEFRVKSKELRVLPNPFVQSASVELEDDRLQIPNSKIQVYDITGKLVEEERFFADAQNDKCETGKNLPQGIYFLKVKGCKPVKIIKIGG